MRAWDVSVIICYGLWWYSSHRRSSNRSLCILFSIPSCFVRRVRLDKLKRDPNEDINVDNLQSWKNNSLCLNKCFCLRSCGHMGKQVNPTKSCDSPTKPHFGNGVWHGSTTPTHHWGLVVIAQALGDWSAPWAIVSQIVCLFSIISLTKFIKVSGHLLGLFSCKHLYLHSSLGACRVVAPPSGPAYIPVCCQ